MIKRCVWLAAALLLAGSLVAQTSRQPVAPATAQPQMTALKATFIPGDKTIFYDDFTDMTPDSAPPHFKIRGSAPQLSEGGGIRQLSVSQRGSIFPNLTALPKNFTLEIELKVDGPGRAIVNMMFASKNKDYFLLSTQAAPGTVNQIASLRAPFEELGRKNAPVNWKEPVKIALWVQNGRVRTFLNGEKHLDFNQVDLPPIDRVEFSHDFYGANTSIGYRLVRFAESAPDFSQTILSSGRYVTHGILFDTDSDCLKPESAPVIQTVAQALQANPEVKLLIEGHTDSSGAAAHNLDLSRRRAEAVKTVLVSQFHIDALRLSSAGLGATKPLDTNDTPQGRSQNRRVEFARQ